MNKHTMAGLMKRRSVIKRVSADDEIVGNGHVHIERMNDDHVWMNVCGHAFDFHAVGGKLVWLPQVDDWPEPDSVATRRDEQ